MIRTYVQLAKPGIVAGNCVSVAGGFLLAARGHGNTLLLIATISGVALVVASACVFNNYIDRDNDARMARTRNRALVQHLVTPAHALLYASVLGLMGVVLLATSANLLAATFAVIGFAIYVGVYSLYMKRRSVHGTWIGSLSGAMPPVVGYCAVTGQFDVEAALLLAIFVLWQIPHSYAIAIFRFEDYAAAGIPVLPVRYGIHVAKAHIIGFIAAFIAAALMLSVTGYVGLTYFAVVTAMGSYWLAVAILGYQADDDRIWARKVFLCSVVIITGLSIMMSVDFGTQHPLDPGTQMLVWSTPLPAR